MRNHHSKYGVFIASCTLFSARLRALCPRSCASAVSLTVEKHGERDTLLVYYVCIWYEGCRSVPLPSTLSTLEDLEKSRVGRRARGRTKRPAEFEKATTNRWDINLKWYRERQAKTNFCMRTLEPSASIHVHGGGGPSILRQNYVKTIARSVLVSACGSARTGCGFS